MDCKWILIFSLFVLGCSPEAQQNSSVNNVEEEAELPEDFNDFYEKFHTDSAYQMEHVVFPLAGTPGMKDTTYVPGTPYAWSKEEWTLHRPFHPENSAFEQEFRLYEMGVVEDRIYSLQGYEMRRRFARIQGEWHLINYNGMQLVSN